MNDSDTPAPAPHLDSGEWIVIEHLDPDGRLAPIADGIRPSALFADGGVNGSTGCNRFRATYEADDAALSIGPAATTIRACAPPADAVERAVLAALDATTGYAIADGRLSLTDADGRVILVLEPSTLELVGTEWSAIAINNGREAVVSLVIGTKASLTFDAEGRVTGFGGCNRIFGAYEVDGDAIRIGPMAGTRMLCAEPAGVAEQEAALLAALEAATTWTIRGGRLQLRDADGALQVDLRPTEAEAA